MSIQPITADGRRSNRNYDKAMKKLPLDDEGKPKAPDVQKGHRFAKDANGNTIIKEYSQRCDGRYGMISKVKSGAGAFMICKIGTSSTRGECSGRPRKRGPQAGKHTLALAAKVTKFDQQKAKEQRLGGESGRDEARLKRFHKLHTLICWKKANKKMVQEFEDLKWTFRQRFSKGRFQLLLDRLVQRERCIKGMQKSRHHPILP